MGINQVNMTTFHPSDFKNDYHARFAKAVQSEQVKNTLCSTSNKVPLLFPDSTSAVVSVIISQSSNGDDETLLLDDCWSSISVKRLKESGLMI